MSLSLLLLCTLCLGSAVVAVTRRNLIHAALLMIATWLGVAAVYLWAGAEFVAFAQVLVYAGAVSMVVLFAVLLTRSRLEPEAKDDPTAKRRVAAGILVAATAAVLLGAGVLGTPLPNALSNAPVLTVRALGLLLAEHHSLAVLAVGLILTVALLGAVILAAQEREDAS